MSEGAYPGIVPEHRPNAARTHCVADGEPWPCGGGAYGMSQDGSWTDPLERYKALREHADTLEQRAEMLGVIVAALVQKHGENVGTSEAPRYRVALTERELTEMPGVISVNLDPCSGALLIRFRPE